MSTAQICARLLVLAAAFIAVASIAAFAGEASPGAGGAAPICCIYLIF